jgi:hypothetical protein
MSLKRNPVTYLILTNALVWCIPLAINQVQSSLASRSVEPSGLAVSQGADALDGLVAGSMPTGAAPLLGAASDASAIPAVELGGTIGNRLQFDRYPATTGISDWNGTEGIADLLEQAAGSPPDLLSQLRGADGLGGPITLQSRQEPLIPIAARAERLQWQRSNDALAALPLHWREPLRRELGEKVQVSQAGLVRLPVKQLTERQEVPVVINDKGLAEGLVAPKDQRTREAVESWAARQAPSKSGTVQVVVIAAEPLESTLDDSQSVVASLPSTEQRLVAAPPPSLPPLPANEP